MPTTADDLRPWLGPAWDDLTPDQRDRLAAESDRIDARYPKDDLADMREAALSAAVQYLLGEVDIDDEGRAYTRSRLETARLSAVCRQLALMASNDGVEKATAARRAGVDRMTLLKDLGKR